MLPTTTRLPTPTPPLLPMHRAANCWPTSPTPNRSTTIPTPCSSTTSSPSRPRTGATTSVETAAPAETPAATRTIQRYAILTASYRLTIKGPDRGKWDVDMTHEADAPLATVERVARGVSKRSGDGSEPEHFSGESLRQALDAPAWIETT